MEEVKWVWQNSLMQKHTSKLDQAQKVKTIFKSLARGRGATVLILHIIIFVTLCITHLIQQTGTSCNK